MQISALEHRRKLHTDAVPAGIEQYNICWGHTGGGHHAGDHGAGSGTGARRAALHSGLHGRLLPAAPPRIWAPHHAHWAYAGKAPSALPGFCAFEYLPRISSGHAMHLLRPASAVHAKIHRGFCEKKVRWRESWVARLRHARAGAHFQDWPYHRARRPPHTRDDREDWL